MKRRFDIIVIVLIFLFSSCSTPSPEPLTDDEIAVLREEYPVLSVYDRWDGLIREEVATLDQAIWFAENWVHAKVKEGVPDQVGYEMLVVSSVYGDLKAGDTFVLADTGIYPSLESGREYLMGITLGEQNMYTTGLEAMFYVANDHVLSVIGAEPEAWQQLFYTGKTVEELSEYLQTTKVRQGKKHVTAMVDYGLFRLNEVYEQADYIVWGEIQSISGSKEQLNDDAEITRIYKDIKVNVQQWIKGWKLSGAVTFMEMGGETDEMIYEVYGAPEIHVGDEVLLFFSEEMGKLCLYIADEDGMIKVPKEMIPEGEVYQNPISIDTYCELIKKIS